MFWILLAFHLVGLVGYSLLLRWQAHKNTLHPWVLATILQTGTFIVPLLLMIFVPPDYSKFTIPAVIISFIVAGFGILLYVAGVKALRYLEASTYAVVFSTRIIVATILGILFLSESPTLLQLIGGLLILSAVMALRQRGKKITNRQGMIWALVAASSASCLALGEKWLINEIGLFNIAPFVVFLGVSAMWIVLLIRKLPLKNKYIFTRQMIGLIFFRTLSSWAWIFALAAGAMISIATYISSLGIILITILGVLILGEKDYLPRKIISVGLAVAGLSFILL